MRTTTRHWRLNNAAAAIVVLPDPRDLTPKCIARLRRYVDALEVEAAVCWEAKEEDERTAAPSDVDRAVDGETKGGQ